jgi:hypothetical protein
MALGTGVFDAQIDHWAPRLGTAPFAIAQLIGGTSFTGYRLAAFLVALVAVGVTGVAIARRTGLTLGVLGAAALTVSWGFFSASHYIRWDSLACLIAGVLLLMVWRRQPGPRVALATGVVLGAALDVQVSLLAAGPGCALLLGWEREGRFKRLGLLAIGFAVAVAAYLGVHVAGSVSEARRQYDLIYRPDFPVPLSQIARQVSIQPYINELNRYRDMASGSRGAQAALLTLLAGAAAGLWAVARSRRPYPLMAVPGFLLLSHMLTLGLIQANKTPMYSWYASPYAIAAIAVGLRSLGRLHPRLAPLPSIGMALLALAGSAVVVNEAHVTGPSAALDPRLSAAVRAVGVRQGTFMAEWLYWWTLPNDRFRFNSEISLDEYAHHESFETAFAHACPSVVMLDDSWLNRYAAGTLFPQFDPTSGAEKPLLLEDLAREYTPVRHLTVDGDTFQFWRRRVARCTPPVG